MNERLTQLTESIRRRIDLIKVTEDQIDAARRRTHKEAFALYDEWVELKPLLKAAGENCDEYLKTEYGKAASTVKDSIKLGKYKHLLEPHLAKNPNLSRRQLLGIVIKVRDSRRKRNPFKTNTQEIVATLKSVYMATTKHDECEQSSSFIFRDGLVIAFNDTTYSEADCPLGDCVCGAVKAKPLLDLLRKLSDEETTFSEVAGELVVTTKQGISHFNVEKTIIVTKPEKGEVLYQQQWLSTAADWRKLPENFADAVKKVVPRTRTERRDFYSSCVHIRPDHVALGGSESKERHKRNVTINVPRPIIVRGDSLRKAIRVRKSVKDGKTIKERVTEFSVSDGWLHFRNETGTLISCAIVDPEKDRVRQTTPTPAANPIAPNPTRQLMIDSGAFTVWTQGKQVDLDKYISYCESRPDASFYVNLDVIPGKPRDPRSLTKDAIETACQQGWTNYRRMIERLPKEKVIPVFHQGDSIQWLEKYLSAGVEYIGISPANDKPTTGGENRATFAHRPAFAQSRRAWLRQIKPYLFDNAGRPVVKTHGFAVTTFKLLKEMEWFSVDSSSWKLAGNNGAVYLPRTRNGEWDFTQDARIVTVSRRLDGYASLGPDTKDKLHRWLDELGVEVGSCKIIEVEDDYTPKIGEHWFDEQNGTVIVPIVNGVVSDTSERLRVNAEFMRRAALALKDHVKEIYFAGAPMPYEPELNLGNRLLSFLQIQTPAAIKNYVEPHERLIRSHSESKTIEQSPANENKPTGTNHKQIKTNAQRGVERHLQLFSASD